MMKDPQVRLNGASVKVVQSGRVSARYLRACQECGAGFEASMPTAAFCTSKCRGVFNNRRRDRGAMLYDLYMAHRHDRKEAEALGVFTAMNRLAKSFLVEDETERAGRLSWHPPAQILERYPYLSAVHVTGTRRQRT